MVFGCVAVVLYCCVVCLMCCCRFVGALCYSGVLLLGSVVLLSFLC